jgi:hypothetical protein
MTSPQQSNLEAAVRYAEAGIPVFPAETYREENSTRWRKKPAITDWQHGTTIDQAIILGWWSQFPDAVPALSLADVNLIAIDVDRHESADGVAAFAALIDGHELPVGPVTHTAGGGMHYIFRQPDSGEPLGNGTGDLPEGIDVRGHGGFIIAAGAVRPDGVPYLSDENSPDLVEAYGRNEIPLLPNFLEEIIRRRRRQVAPVKAAKADQRPLPTRREEAYGLCALEGCAKELENATRGQRNTTLNAVTYRVARMSAAGWIDPPLAMRRLVKAVKKCGLLADDGPQGVLLGPVGRRVSPTPTLPLAHDFQRPRAHQAIQSS